MEASIFSTPCRADSIDSVLTPLTYNTCTEYVKKRTFADMRAMLWVMTTCFWEFPIHVMLKKMVTRTKAATTLILSYLNIRMSVCRSEHTVCQISTAMPLPTALATSSRWRDYNPTETRKKNDASLFDFFGLNRMTPSTNRDIPDKKSKYVFTLLSIDFHLRRSENHHSTLYLQGRGHF